MSEDIVINKIISAFKGLANSHRLEPINYKSDALEPDKIASLGLVFSNEEGEDFQLYYEVKSFERVLGLIEKRFPGQIDHRLSSRILVDILLKWITEGRNVKNHEQSEIIVLELVDQIKNEIKSRLIFLPIEGLEFKSSDGLIVGNCQLFDNHKDSDFRQMLYQDRKRDGQNEISNDHWSESVTAYFTCNLTGHPNRIMEQGLEEARLSLSIIRLYLSSYYHHENKRSIVKRMGLSGSLHLDERTRVFYISPEQPIEEQFPGGKESRTIHRNLAINSEFVEYMKRNGFDQINEMLQPTSLNDKDNDLARRLLRTITWFSKATTAKSLVDSYLMYAIAIEALLAKDRAIKEIYATFMAALVTCNNEDCTIYPVGGYLSSDFAQCLEKAVTLNDRFNLIRDRVLALFTNRNNIVHGVLLEDNLDESDLLDFETLVQNSILAFIKKGWNSLGEFSTWVHQNTRYDFMPEKQQT